ncbi:2648_t:CDS:1, partial [Dentiscutata heterogama]
ALDKSIADNTSLLLGLGESIGVSLEGKFITLLKGSIDSGSLLVSCLSITSSGVLED